MSISVVRVGVKGLGELFFSRTSRCTSGSWRGRPRLTSFLVTTGGRGCLERRKREVPRAAREAAGQPGARLLGRALSLDRRQTAGHPQDRGVAATVRWAAKWRSARCEMRAYSDTPAASSSRCSSAVISQSTFSSSDESGQWVM